MSASSGTTLISPTANGPAAGGSGRAASTTSSERDRERERVRSPRSDQRGSGDRGDREHREGGRGHRKHTRYNSHHSAHGHGHHAVHHGHAPRRSSRSSRRSSEGEAGRRALAAGLTMHALDGKKRKESAGSVAMQRSASDASRRSVSGDSPVLGRTPSNTSVLSSESGRKPSAEHRPSTDRAASDRPGPGPAEHRPSADRSASDRPDKPERTESGRKRAEEETVEVLVPPETPADEGEEDDWESGEETPATVLKDAGLAPAQRAVAPEDKQQAKEAGVLAESPLDLRQPSHSPKHDAPKRTKGFPGTPTPLQTPSAPSTGGNSQPASRAGSRRPSLSNRSQSRISLTRPADSTTSLTSLHTEEKPKKDEPAEYPFPKMREARGRGAISEHPSQEISPREGKSGSKDTVKLDSSPDTTPEAAAHKPPRLLSKDEQGSPESYVDPDPERTATTKSSATLPRPLSVSSLRSIQSLRAPPHPLNSPTGRSGFLDSPRSAKRVASLHYPPAAPAVVNCETVEGQGYDLSTPPTPTARPTRPERVGSFSSVRSLQGVLGTPARPGASSRRQTAAQAAQAAARLNTTTDPVAYHHSLGFSHATAETAHLLSRFLPARRARRPRWAISAREAMAVHEALAAGEEPDIRVGLTDGQYRESHESLVATLRELGKNRKGVRRGASRSYSYQALLGGVGAEELGITGQGVPRRRASGQTPFEMSVNRCLAQRP